MEPALARSIDAMDSNNNSSSGNSEKAFMVNNIIEDDELIENIFSYCDFHSAIKIGKTCKRFKKISDDCLDHVVASIMKNDNMYETIADNGGQYDTELKLRKNKCTYETRAALVQDGIESCNPMDIQGDYYPPEHLNFDEDQARYLLQTRGYVEIEDFLTAEASDDDGNNDYDETGWSVRIKLRNDINLQQAAMEIMRPGHEDNTNYYEDEKEIWKYSHCETEYHIIYYHSLCLLRKADLSSFHHKFLNVDTRNNGYPQNKHRSSFSFKVLPSSLLSSMATTTDVDADDNDNDNDNGNNNNDTQFEFYYKRETNLRYW